MLKQMDAASDGSLLPIKMFKILFPDSKIADLNKSIDKKKYYSVHTKVNVYHKVAFAKLQPLTKALSVNAISL